MRAPEVSFGIPFYSGVGFLKKALESVLAQRDSGWRAFVSDDSPDPATGAEAAALIRSLGDVRIGYHRNPRSLGISGNWNRCLDLADTDLVTVLHADDELFPDYCGAMRAAAERHPAAVAFYCQAEIVGPDSRKVFSLPDLVKGFINPSTRDEVLLAGEPGFRALLWGNFIICPSLCFRKSVLGARRFSDRRFVLDWDMTTQLVLDGETLVGLPRRGLRYRRHTDSATSQLTRNRQRFLEESDYYDRMLPVARARGWERCVRLARHRRILKLNVTLTSLMSLARLRLTDAREGLRLLREMGRAAGN
jgi:glycosyltransferase involved in cell wall biosynthesis